MDNEVTFEIKIKYFPLGGDPKPLGISKPATIKEAVGGLKALLDVAIPDKSLCLVVSESVHS